MEPSFKIASYNIQHGTRSQDILKNIIALAKDGVAVFCLQEVRHYPNKEFIVDALLNNLGPTWKAEYLISSQTFDLGLCTIWDSSKIKSTSFDSVFLPKLAKIRLYEKIYLKMHRRIEKVDNKNINPETKAALIGEFKFAGQSIRITNTHLDWLGGSQQRLNQLKHIKEKLSSVKPCVFEVLCGDFNTLGHYKLSRRFKKKIQELLNGEFLPVFKSIPTTKSWQTLDHMLVKNLEIIKSEVLKLKGSDHYPLLAEVRIK